MDILVQKPVFRHSSTEYYEPPPIGYYTPYTTPPYSQATPVAPHPSWHLGEQMPSVFQLTRFPTPPITPDQHPPHSPRTQSVIMKCSRSSSGSGSGSPTESYSDHCSNSSSSSSSSGGDCDFLCNWHDCGRVFESLEALAQHVTLRHAIASLLDGLYYCRWGGCQRSERGFNARYKMLVHVRTHTKEKPHRCHLCEKSFSRAENLKIHIRSHSGEKPYKCHFEGCQKAYSNSSDRFKHTRTHSMEKPYMCKVPGCHKRYTDPSSLRKHVKTFKHSIQLIASQSNTLMLQAAAERAASSTTYHTMPHTEPALPAPLASLPPVESSSSSRYYVESESEPSDYSLRAKHSLQHLHHDTEYNTSSSDYWLNAGRYLHSEDYAATVAMELDTSTHPLDLRVHRS